MARNPLEELRNTNNAIERHLGQSDIAPRGSLAQDVVNQLRHLTEHLAMLSVYGGTQQIEGYYEKINPSLISLKGNSKTRFLWEFHRLLQKTVSHYTPNEDESQRLLLKYREYLHLCKQHARNHLGVDILNNLDGVKWDEDTGLQRYYRAIAERLNSMTINQASNPLPESYYIYSRKPFFVDGDPYYEYSLVPAVDFVSKFDHISAFSTIRIPDNYAISVSVLRTSISALGSTLPLLIIVEWDTAIRPCEINKLLSVLNCNKVVSKKYTSYNKLMNVITASGNNLLDLALLPQDYFNRLIDHLSSSQSQSQSGIVLLLQQSRYFLQHESPTGKNALRYLLYRPRNIVLTDQLDSMQNKKLGGLRLKNGVKPFDTQPYCTDLIKHRVSFYDLIMCINPDSYDDNMLARNIAHREVDANSVYISEKDAGTEGDVDSLIKSYNESLYYKHQNRRLIHEMGHLFLQGAEDDLASIIHSLLALSKGGIDGYRAAAESRLKQANSPLDDPQKCIIACDLFSSSKVAFIYGSAGTGKSTLVNIICEVLAHLNKIAIANTNPAVENLRERVRDSRCRFMTVARYMSTPSMDKTNLLIIDECSTVSNADMRKILARGHFDLLLLVGDVCQIEAISLGNWFSVARHFIKQDCIFTLETSWRTASEELKYLWKAVRHLEDDIAERLVSGSISKPLTNDLFESISDDEIVLCLNYDGLYGINNINRLMQAMNPNKAFNWGLNVYKSGDPILFNESMRFSPVLYNNLKGRIASISREGSSLWFEVLVDIPLNALEVEGIDGLTYISGTSDGKTRVRFQLTKAHEDENGVTEKTSVVPFQVAYAISIHKAQGLEYNSVKIVIAKNIEEQMSHSIFYTAITRAKQHLKIYWSPESQQRIISSFKHANHNEDLHLLSIRKGIPLIQ